MQSRMEPSRADYCHPYQPYDIQLDFMRGLYRSIEDGKVAIFESPTGTGKSLSLICGALTWLRDDARRRTDSSDGVEGEDDSHDWLVVAEKAARKRDLLLELKHRELSLIAIRKKEAAYSQAADQFKANKKARLNTDAPSPMNGKDDDFVLDDYLSGDEKTSAMDKGNNLSSSTLALLDKLEPTVKEDVEEVGDHTKVIFCSRTHSQLTQFINELRRVTPPPGVIHDSTMADSLGEEVVKHLSLGSRKNLCINERVARPSSNLAINERCLELQKPGTANEHRCKFLPNRDNRDKVERFRDRAIATIRDIEDLGKLGRRMEICPYYASRSVIAFSEVLTLPYPLLLQKSAREALGVEVENNIIIIDEAHNLMDAISDTLSMSLSLLQLETATKQVVTYVEHFKNKLKGQNRLYITQLVRLLNSFSDCLRRAELSRHNEYAITAADLMSGKGADQVKPHKLLQYLMQSKLAYKVEGYMEVQADKTGSARPAAVLMHFQSFLLILMNPDSEGRFFISRREGDIVVRYTLLDPREHFRDIVEKARAVVLAGGTMSPMSDYKDFLFSYLDESRLSTFSFGHVIPADNMLATSVVSGPSGAEFDFTYGKRASQSMVVELGNLLARVCAVVPDGVVVFFPSYDYLALVLHIWDRSPSVKSVISVLSAIKPVFKEVRGEPTEELLQEYSRAIDSGKGAVLLSVVGGKLSEGINFSDKLGRAVVAVGLPFPNMQSPVWRAKLDYVEKVKFEVCKTTEGLGIEESKLRAKAARRDFYENACMRAVNQSIGRAIRHKNDYAAILLIDKRFATLRIQQKLPRWIRGSMKDIDKQHPWLAIEEGITRFFQEKA